VKKFEKIPATYEETGRIKVENRANKTALVASLKKEERETIEKWLKDVVVKDFGGYQSLDSD
jgi:hypothetical protein